MRRKSGDVEADGFPNDKIIVLVPLYMNICSELTKASSFSHDIP